MTTRNRRTADFIQLVVVATAALVGGLAAMLVLAFRNALPQPGIMLFVVLVVTVLAVLALATWQTSPRRRAWPPPDPRPYRPGTPPQVGPWTSPPRTPSSEGPVFSLDRTWPSRPDWYDEDDEVAVPALAAPAALPPISPTPPPAPPPDDRPARCEEFVVPGAPRPSEPAVRRIVQCPECGDFEVDLHSAGDDRLAFSCLRRGHRWTWERGTPWPTTVIRPAAAPVRPTGTV